MYKKIIVPLDGSKLAECVLPHIENIAKGSGTEEIILVTVTERVSGLLPKDNANKISAYTGNFNRRWLLPTGRIPDDRLNLIRL